MAVYLKEFENHTQYDAYINGSGAILPNVSICTTEGDVHYNPYVEPVETRVVAKFNVTSTSSPTKILSATTGFSKIEIDGVEQPSVTTGYTFRTTGEHTVKYTLTDPTSIGSVAFRNCRNLTSVTIPDSVTSIDERAFADCGDLKTFNSTISGTLNIPSGVTSIGVQTFQNCSGLTSIDIPDSVTSIGNYAFNSCKFIQTITSKSLVAPTIGNGTFFDSVIYGGTLYVPQGSTGYDVWMGSGSYYLGRYSWTKVEQ